MAAFDMPATILYAVFGALSVFTFIRKGVCAPARVEAYLRYLWVYFLVFCTAELFSITTALWLLAVVCFVSLREYFSLLDIRLQDRWGILGAYLVIPFMIYYIADRLVRDVHHLHPDLRLPGDPVPDLPWGER